MLLRDEDMKRQGTFAMSMLQTLDAEKSPSTTSNSTSSQCLLDHLWPPTSLWMILNAVCLGSTHHHQVQNECKTNKN
jgi:hypothetical protein